MTVEKYVKMIVKRIRCSRKKRIEIGKQLLSDISSELDNHDLEGLKEHATDEMSAVLTSETIENARNGISDDWGDFRSFGIVYMSELKQRGHYYAVTQVTASYENVSVTYTITFDENMKLSGLYMK